ncbi:hypothetical protein GCM10010470_26500 [Saccharopolyspora taberi]|uniref:Uncharacterized protein n=1 Tax=Saccharopolyspora taberi TaxID=60895 RepID=A0ABN3VBZ5_9PSEU
MNKRPHCTLPNSYKVCDTTGHLAKIVAEFRSNGSRRAAGGGARPGGLAWRLRVRPGGRSRASHRPDAEQAGHRVLTGVEHQEQSHGRCRQTSRRSPSLPDLVRLILAIAAAPLPVLAP